MCLAMLLSLAGEGIIIAEAHYGAERHVGDIPPAMYSEGMQNERGFRVDIRRRGCNCKSVRRACIAENWGHSAYRYLVMTVMVIIGSWAFLSIFVSRVTT